MRLKNPGSLFPVSRPVTHHSKTTKVQTLYESLSRSIESRPWDSTDGQSSQMPTFLWRPIGCSLRRLSIRHHNAISASFCRHFIAKQWLSKQEIALIRFSKRSCRHTLLCRPLVGSVYRSRQRLLNPPDFPVQRCPDHRDFLIEPLITVYLLSLIFADLSSG